MTWLKSGTVFFFRVKKNCSQEWGKRCSRIGEGEVGAKGTGGVVTGDQLEWYFIFPVLGLTRSLWFLDLLSSDIIWFTTHLGQTKWNCGYKRLVKEISLSVCPNLDQFTVHSHFILLIPGRARKTSSQRLTPGSLITKPISRRSRSITRSLVSISTLIKISTLCLSVLKVL